MIDLREILSKKFSISNNDLDKATAYQAKYGGRIEQILINIGAMSEDSLPGLYAVLAKIELAEDCDIVAWSGTEQESLMHNQLMQHDWYIVAKKASTYHLIVRDPFSISGNQLCVLNDLSTSIKVATESQIQQLRKLHTQQDKDLVDVDELTDLEEDRLRELADEAPTVNLLNGLITRALKARASDMHLEPIDNKFKVRFRVDGVLQEVDWISNRMRLPVASRLKILSGMDIAEKRRPQDGKIAMRIANEDIDIRVSSLPLNYGESIVMRFLRQNSVTYDMKELGLSDDIEHFINEDIVKTSGVILLTGPTGSGKTTSLYTFLNAINSDKTKIITLEDPVEYQLAGVNQVQVQPNIGFDFASGLRSIVRQDPDVIMIGEIRDLETARTAMQSALTGHLVFSTVHTNDAASAYTRLLDLGVEEFILNAALVSIIAQRLVRKLCTHCSVPSNIVNDKYDLAGLAAKHQISLNLREPAGCEKCAHTGYRGRVAIVEYLRCDEAIAQLDKDELFPNHARKLNKERGGRTLFEDGLLKVVMGQTTIDEVLRVAG